MRRTVVDINRSPHSVGLVGWGRAPDGAWWGCVVWDQWVTADNADEQIRFGAWVPATDLSQRSMASNEPLPRIDLPTDSQLWPAPPCWPCWYVGVWTTGPAVAPSGLELVTGAAWRRRAQRR